MYLIANAMRVNKCQYQIAVFQTVGKQMFHQQCSKQGEQQCRTCIDMIHRADDERNSRCPSSGQRMFQFHHRVDVMSIHMEIHVYITNNELKLDAKPFVNNYKETPPRNRRWARNRERTDGDG